MSTDARRPRRERTVRKVVSVSPAGLEGGQYRPLREADVLRIHQAALQVLERTGVEVMESECRTIFAAAGARVDAGLNRVYLPAAMVEHALKVANHNVVLYSRDGRNDLHLRDKRVHLGTGGAAVHVLDLESGTLRDSQLRDLFDIGRMVDQLVGIQSWTTGEEYKTYWIEYTLKTREILSGYEGSELWKAILMQLDQHQVLQFTDDST